VSLNIRLHYQLGKLVCINWSLFWWCSVFVSLKPESYTSNFKTAKTVLCHNTSIL